MKLRVILVFFILFGICCEDNTVTRDNPFDSNNPNYLYSSISGRILDSRISLPIVDCTIILDGVDTVISNDEGEYSFSNLIHGEHNIVFEKENYLTEHDTIVIEYNTSFTHNKDIIEDVPYLEISDSVLIFLPEENSKDFILYNSGTQILDWIFDYDDESILVDVNSGIIGPNEYQEINITVDKSILEVGSHDIPISLISNGGNYNITLNISVEPILVVTTDSIRFDIDTLSSLFGLTNPGGGMLDFTINEDITWLTLSQYTGQIAGDTLLIEAIVDTNYLDNGDNLGSIYISSENGLATITSSIYFPFPPLLEVSANILDFSIDLETMTFSIINGGDGVLIWNISQTENWFSVIPQNGEIVDEEIVNVTVDRSLLYEGNYNFNMVINSNAQSEEIDIDLEVLTNLQVSETSFYFDGSTDELFFEISNSGNGIMPWSIDIGDSWIQLSDEEGEIIDESVQINVNVDQSGFENGYYNSYINISSGEDQYIIDVEMYVPQPPTLEVSNNDLDFGTDQNEMHLFISNGGEGDLIWSISENISWLSISPDNGMTTTEQDQITVMIYDDNLSNGEYSENFTITSNGGSEEVNVTLYVVDPLYEDFADVSDWSGDIGDNGWNIINSNYCQEPPCANAYFCSTCEEEDVQINRQIWVESGMELQIYTFTYWAFDLRIYLGESLILESSSSYGVENLSHTITFTGQTDLSIVSGYNYLGSGYIDELSIE